MQFVITITTSLFVGLLLQLPSVSGQSCVGTSCLECVASNCAWFPVNSIDVVVSDGSGECLESCSVITDVPCYSTEVYPNDLSETICANLENDTSDWITCSQALDCTSCVRLFQTDGISPCIWNNEGEFCGSGLCTSFGCGSTTTTTCPNTPVPAPTVDVPVAPVPVSPTTNLCNIDATSCEECLLASDNSTEVPYECAWASVTQQCLNSCVSVSGFPCYSPIVYPNLIGNSKEICNIATVATKDDTICDTADTCASCITVSQSDNVTKCLWFERDDGSNVVPYCGAHNTSTTSIQQVDMNGCDLNNSICGVSDCSLINMVQPPSSTSTPNMTSSSGEKERYSMIGSSMIVGTIMVLFY